MSDFNLTPLAASLPATVPFVGPETQERALGRPFLARIGANESLFGPSPKAIAAMAQAAGEAWMYGDPTCHDLRHALAEHLGVRPEAILVGEGIDGLQANLVRLFIGPGDAVVTSAGAYPTFNYHVVGYGGTLHQVPYRDDHEDIDALLTKAQKTRAKLIYFANPDNPMGTWHDAAAVQRLIDGVPPGCLLVLDEAYIDTAPKGTAPNLDATDTRVIRMRTFSKAHGLAGLRVGYAMGHPELIAAFDRVRNHFGMGRVQQVGALAALKDQAHLQYVLSSIETQRQTLAELTRSLGLIPLPSATNFLAVDLHRDGAYARRVIAALAEEQVFARMPGVAPLDRCIRLSVPDAAAFEVLATALPKALKAAL